MKKLLLSILFLTGAAQAAPFLTLKNEYPNTGAVPHRAFFNINGGNYIPCQLDITPTGVTPKCDLSVIVASGTYTLIMRVESDEQIVNHPDGALWAPAGSASSAPFVLELKPQNVPTPTLRVTP